MVQTQVSFILRWSTSYFSQLTLKDYVWVTYENLYLDLGILLVLQVFLRDSQHALLQTRLHSEQIHKICVLQRWIKGTLQRKHFIRQRNAAVTIQVTTMFSVRFCFLLHLCNMGRIASFMCCAHCSCAYFVRCCVGFTDYLLMPKTIVSDETKWTRILT